MKRIYQNNDLIFNLTVNNFPINVSLINTIEFKFYTINPSNCIVKTYNDINEYNQVILQWDELKNLEEGVLFYDYNVSLIDTTMSDGTKDSVTKVMTNYYIVTSLENIVTDEYYTKDEINELLDNISTGGDVDIDLSNYALKDHTHSDYMPYSQIWSLATKNDLTNYYNKTEVDSKFENYVEDDTLGSYYTKNEINDLLDTLEVGDIDLSNYYTKAQTEALIPSTEGFIKEIPSEYITETELSDSLNGYSETGHTHSEYLTEHQSLEEYVTEDELNEKGYITTQYDDTEVLNRISALENEISGISETITEINELVV